MHKNLLSKTMIVALAVSLVLIITVGAAGEGRTDAGARWKYVLEDGNATIVGYVEEPAENIVFPSELDGYPVTRIGSWMSDDIYITSVTIPDSVTSIGANAFAWYCGGLTSVTIPDSVTSIGDSAFYYCDLKSVTIPAGVTDIGRNPFEGCPLTSIDVAADNPVYEQIDGVLFDTHQKMLVAYPHAREINPYAIPAGVLRIGDMAFSNNGGLTSVIIPDSVTCIGDMAFWACVNLTSVTIPDSVTSIGCMAFYECDNLTGVTIPGSVTTIGEDAFGNCEELTLRVARGSVAEQYAKENSIPYITTSTLTDRTESADELLMKQIDEYFTMSREEIIEKLGPHYEDVGAGPEGAMDGYYYEDLGMAFAFYPDSDTVEMIECYPDFRIRGVGIGSRFSEIMEALGDTEIVETWLELPIYTVYCVQYCLGNAEYTFIALLDEDAPVDILRIYQTFDLT